ncbi:hypothetical protein GCM10022198_20670 [Klugiella xanthotipulae]|uniref:DUF3137 domain-containing protein n=1 Tax=Klugiella xanthotipulae TaxID=244735 RepID=A0A543HXS3_9MICO|nr:hypothetical protein [Klugiella xanthotipulae]TQM63154.1 hypothetical protein FB466_1408 [Klugiella xanthotipulae]
MSTTPPVYTPRNFSALGYAPSTAERQAFRQYLLQRYGYRLPLGSGLLVGIILGLLFLWPIALGGLLLSIGGVGNLIAGNLIGAVYTVVGLGMVAFGVGMTWCVIWASRRSVSTSLLTTMRLFSFARDNRFQFTPRTENPLYPGMIFNLGHGRASCDRVHSLPGQRFFDIGRMTYRTSNGKSDVTHTWGYLAFQLDRRLPHIVLDSLSNNPLWSNLPDAFNRDQRLSLEGDFDRYFTLYCPREYERDALYILTPDVMALLIDHAAPFDVEIVDDLVFVYSAAPFDHNGMNAFVRMWQVLDTVGAKTLRQTHRYADERVPDRSLNVVAPPGRRLRRSYLPALIVGGIVLLVSVLTTIIPVVIGLIVALTS